MATTRLRFRNLNPFRFPKKRHRRTQNPGKRTRYQAYKPFLRDEFERKCVYCRTPEGMKGGYDNYGVDHYRPKSKYPKLELAYDNLFYACNPCNRLKGDFDSFINADIFIPNPCEHRIAEHLQFQSADVYAKSAAGRFIIERLRLDDADLTQLREFTLDGLEKNIKEHAVLVAGLAKLEGRIANLENPAALKELEDECAEIRQDIDKTKRNLDRLTGR